MELTEEQFEKFLIPDPPTLRSLRMRMERGRDWQRNQAAEKLTYSRQGDTPEHREAFWMGMAYSDAARIVDSYIRDMDKLIGE